MSIDYTAVVKYGFRFTAEQLNEICAKLDIDDGPDSLDDFLKATFEVNWWYAEIGSAYQGDEDTVFGPHVEMTADPSPIKPEHLDALAKCADVLGLDVKPSWHIGIHIW